jgi:DNA-binding IclR family transcriptional regulator
MPSSETELMGTMDRPTGPRRSGLNPSRLLESPRSRAELPVILLASGYNLRVMNAVRARFDGRAERAAVPLVLWLTARLADADPIVGNAAMRALSSLFPERPPDPGELSLRQLGGITGLPRETLRRTAAKLEKAGWVARVGGGRLSATGQFTEYLHGCGERERLMDFRWTAARIRELLSPTAADIGASVADALAAMRSCRSEELTASLRSPLPGEVPPIALSAALVLMHGYNLRHLLRLMPLFDGDLLQVVVLGEVAIRNIAVLSPELAKEGHDLATVLKLTRPDESIFTDPRRGMNAYSLASCLGIAYETMRRKLAQLVERAYLQRDERGGYWLMPHVPDVFRGFNQERRADLLITADTIEALLRSASPITPEQVPS